MVEVVDTDKDIFDENDNKIGYWRKLEDGKDDENLYEVYFDDRNDKGDDQQAQELVATEDEAEEAAYDYAKQ